MIQLTKELQLKGNLQCLAVLNLMLQQLEVGADNHLQPFNRALYRHSVALLMNRTFTLGNWKSKRNCWMHFDVPTKSDCSMWFFCWLSHCTSSKMRLDKRLRWMVYVIVTWFQTFRDLNCVVLMCARHIWLKLHSEWNIYAIATKIQRSDGLMKWRQQLGVIFCDLTPLSFLLSHSLIKILKKKLNSL